MKQPSPSLTRPDIWHIVPCHLVQEIRHLHVLLVVRHHLGGSDILRTHIGHFPAYGANIPGVVKFGDCQPKLSVLPDAEYYVILLRYRVVMFVQVNMCRLELRRKSFSVRPDGPTGKYAMRMKMPNQVNRGEVIVHVGLNVGVEKWLHQVHHDTFIQSQLYAAINSPSVHLDVVGITSQGLSQNQYLYTPFGRLHGHMLLENEP